MNTPPSLDEVWAETQSDLLDVPDVVLAEFDKEQDYLYRHEKLQKYRYLANACRRRGAVSTAGYYEAEINRLVKIGENNNGI